MQQDQDQSQRIIRKDILNLTCEFLETWLHQILYQRTIYPRSIFELEKKFQVPVYIAQHPGVQSYLSNFVKTCHPLLEKGDLKFIALTVIENNEPIEKFVFEINSYLKNLDIPLHMILESESIYALADLEHHLRACLIKMNACPPRPSSSSSTTPSPNSESSSSQLKLQSSDITFQLSIEKNQDGYPERSKSSKKDKHKEIDWIPAEITFGWKNIIPLKSVSMDLFHVSLVLDYGTRDQDLLIIKK